MDRRPRSSIALATTLLVALLGARPVLAQVERLDSNRPEAWAMFYFTSVTIFSGLGTPRSLEPGHVELGLELGNIPHLDEDQRRVGFEGTKVEDLNNAPILARPVLTIGLPWRVVFSLAYIPPIKVFGVRPNILSLAIARPIFEQGPWTVGLRLHGGLGKTKGAFTCPGHTVRSEPGSGGNPFGCDEKSDDRVHQRYVGLELSGSYRIEALHDLTPYLTLGANYLDPEFHVRALTFGFEDRARLGADTWTFTLGAGFGLPVRDDTWLSIGVFYSPLWVTRPPSTGEERDSMVNVRAQLTYRLY